MTINKHQSKFLIIGTILLVGVLFSTFFIIKNIIKSFTEKVPGPGSTGLANPASAHCIEQGYKLEIRSDASGNQYGVCLFPDRSECEEWAYYEGECKIGINKNTE